MGAYLVVGHCLCVLGPESRVSGARVVDAGEAGKDVEFVWVRSPICQSGEDGMYRVGW
jgi:hypothetical protein